MFNNDLCIVNADKDRCLGTFTRVVANSVSLLDLVIEGGGPTVLVHSMVVDELNQFLAGSNHSPLIVTLNVGAEGYDTPVAQEIRVPNPSDLNKDLFQYKFMTLCGVRSLTGVVWMSHGSVRLSKTPWYSQLTKLVYLLRRSKGRL